MSDYVRLKAWSVRGWPWPDRSWGLSPMYGEAGWCKGCGTPLKAQCGSLTLRTKGMQRVKGVWVPNWRFDSVCLDADLAAHVAAHFAVTLRPIAWRGKAPVEAAQIVPTASAGDWFEADELKEAAIRRHGKPGATCPACGLWRWLPIPDADLPPVQAAALPEGHDVIASPEWFGAGCQSLHELLFRRPLAELLAAASPRTVELREVRVAGEPE